MSARSRSPRRTRPTEARSARRTRSTKTRPIKTRSTKDRSVVTRPEERFGPLRRWARAAAMLGAHAGLSVVCLCLALVQTVAVVTTMILVGALFLQPLVACSRPISRAARRLAARYLDRPVIGEPAPATERTWAGRVQLMLADRATWRDLAWMYVEGLTGWWLWLVALLLPPLAAPTARLQARLAAGLLSYGRSPLPAAGGAPRPGHGLVGMRERAEMLGGTFEAGPLPDGGFRVRAVLPTGTNDRS